MENNIKSLKYLIDRLNELLDKEAYTASTRKDMNFILDALSSYMQNHNLAEYTADVRYQNSRALCGECSLGLHP